MRLLRFAIARFWSETPIKSGHTQIGGVIVELIPGQPASGKEQSYLVTATLPLAKAPIRDGAKRVVIPENERERCEFAIEVPV